MRKRNKNLIILSITTIILLIALGVTYAVYQMSITGSNQELIVGDIYMKYTETNQITLGNAMPFDISKNNIVNPVMASQTYEEDTRNELSQCVIYSSGWPFDEGEDAESYCKGTGTKKGNTFQYDLYMDNFSSSQLTELESKNIIVEQGEVIKITDYDTSCGSDVVIPKTINNLKVVNIGDYAFRSKNLTSVVIPNSVVSIGGSAFRDNQLTEVFIPESVAYLSCSAFDDEVVVHKSDSLVCTLPPPV